MLLAVPRTHRGRRFAQLLVGLGLFGAGLALMVRSELGLGPWDVFHQGISRRTGASIGTVNILVGVVVVLGWIPLRQRLGIGTLLNTVLVGATMDAVLAWVDPLDGTAQRWAALLVGIAIGAAGVALYIGAGLGTGPRDGLMTGFAARSGHSIRAVRTTMEVAALVLGWLLGGDVGVGTVIFAGAIGPLLQYGLGRVTIPASPPIE
jgi:uncharacterized membrane protein YczE